MIENIKRSFQDAAEMFTQFATDQNIINTTEKVGLIISDCFRKGNKLLIFGNGGSSTDAMHFAEELTGKFRKDRKPLPAISLTDSSHITCVANDYGFEEIFARGVEALGKKGDIAIGISTSGNSKNVIKALNKAKDNDDGTDCGRGIGNIKGRPEGNIQEVGHVAQPDAVYLITDSAAQEEGDTGKHEHIIEEGPAFAEKEKEK